MGAPLPVADAESAIRAVVGALRGGDAGAAKRICEELIAADSPLPPPWLLLAQACRRTGDEAREAEALARVLEAQPRNVGALIMRGDGHARAGDDRAAASFYEAALRAAGEGGPVSALLAAELKRVGEAVAGAEGRYARHLDARLADVPRTARFDRSIDILLGRRDVYPQQPSSFYFPELPQRQFYEREEFGWLPAIEAATGDMRAELVRVMDEDGAFRPYIEAEPNRPTPKHALLGDPSWSAFHFFEGGVPIAANVARCPRTAAALAKAPQPFIRGRSPMALFSLLRPGAHIAAHNGLLNTRLICHLPLIVPPGCRLRVGNETREWEPGRALIFDDSIEHEAWNDGAETRVVLLFEIWRPEITADERAALTAMFEAITDFGPARQGPAAREHGPAERGA